LQIIRRVVNRYMGIVLKRSLKSKGEWQQDIPEALGLVPEWTEKAFEDLLQQVHADFQDPDISDDAYNLIVELAEIVKKRFPKSVEVNLKKGQVRVAPGVWDLFVTSAIDFDPEGEGFPVGEEDFEGYPSDDGEGLWDDEDDEGGGGHERSENERSDRGEPQDRNERHARDHRRPMQERGRGDSRDTAPSPSSSPASPANNTTPSPSKHTTSPLRTQSSNTRHTPSKATHSTENYPQRPGSQATPLRARPH